MRGVFGRQSDGLVTTFLLRLYVARTSATSRQAEQNFERLRRLIGADMKVEIIDVVAHPELAEKAGILATPTLSYEHPDRPRRIIGDLSDPHRVIGFLGLVSKDEGQPT